MTSMLAPQAQLIHFGVLPRWLHNAAIERRQTLGGWGKVGSTCFWCKRTLCTCRRKQRTRTGVLLKTPCASPFKITSAKDPRLALTRPARSTTHQACAGLPRAKPSGAMTRMPMPAIMPDSSVESPPAKNGLMAPSFCGAKKWGAVTQEGLARGPKGIFQGPGRYSRYKLKVIAFSVISRPKV